MHTPLTNGLFWGLHGGLFTSIIWAIGSHHLPKETSERRLLNEKLESNESRAQGG